MQFDSVNAILTDILDTKADAYGGTPEFKVGYLKTIIYEMTVAHPETEATLLTLRDFLNSRKAK